MPETFKARVGLITVDDKTIQLRARDGELIAEWPPRFENVPRMDSIDAEGVRRLRAEGRKRDRLLFRVIRAMRNRPDWSSYREHPVIRGWIQHHEGTIAVLRGTGVPFSDPRLQNAEKALAQLMEPEAVRAAKKPHKSVEELMALRRAELRDLEFVNLIHKAWWELRGRYNERDERDQAVIAECIPSGYAAFAPNYDETLKGEIMKWIDIFERRCLTPESERLHHERTSLLTAIDFRIEQEFGKNPSDNIRRGHQRAKKALRQ